MQSPYWQSFVAKTHAVCLYNGRPNAQMAMHSPGKGKISSTGQRHVLLCKGVALVWCNHCRDARACVFTITAHMGDCFHAPKSHFLSVTYMQFVFFSRQTAPQKRFNRQLKNLNSASSNIQRELASHEKIFSSLSSLLLNK